MSRFKWGRATAIVSDYSAVSEWISVHRLQSAAQLAAQSSPIQIIDDENALYCGDSPSADGMGNGKLDPHGRLDEEEPFIDFGGPSTQHSRSSVQSAAKPTRYQIERSAYAPLRALFQSEATDRATASPPDDPPSFTNDAVLLSLPKKDQSSGGLHFLTAIIQSFAKDVKADLLTLDVEDISDLQQHVLRSKTKVDHWQNGGFKQFAQELESLSLDDFPFTELLSLPDSLNRNATTSANGAPFVIHLREVCNTIEVHGLPFLRELRKAISSKRRDGCTIVFLTIARSSQVAISSFAPLSCSCGSCEGYLPRQVITEYGRATLHTNRKVSSRFDNEDREDVSFGDFDIYDKAKMLEAVGMSPLESPICAAPIQSTTQAALLDEHRKIDESCTEYNVRGLKRWLRQRSNEYHRRMLLQPFVTWQFMEGTDIQRRWADHPIQHLELAAKIPDTLSDEELSDSILHVDCCQADSVQDDQSAGAAPNRFIWRTPKPTTNHIKEDVEYRCSTKERTLLNCVVWPQDSQEGWNEIAVDQNIKNTMLRILGLQSRNNIPDYGLLKNNSTRGALLYGPPGTGKTHLARILARESHAVLLSVSPGEIESKWHGETEQNINALFSLARKLSPSIIFIDEADAIFARRRSSSEEHSRQSTNQLLQEMDGLRRSNDAPFMLLATNIPGDLDYAVYRRVPNRVYMGLPTKQLRLELLQIFLRDEVLDATMDLEYLAHVSSGYSGSDLRTFCVQAAQSCDTCVGPRDRRRLLRLSHFETALRGTASTVSVSSLAKVKGFAAEYDPSALAKIKQDSDLLTVIVNRVAGEQTADEKDQKRYDFHRPDFENNRPSLQNLDLESLPLDHGIADIVQGQQESDPISELEMDELDVSPTDASLTYESLKPNSKQIRVLYLLPSVGNRGDSKDEAPRCSMKIVSLEDWSDFYRAFLAWMKEQRLPLSPKYRHALWALVGAYSYAVSQVRQGKADVVEGTDLIDWTESRLSCDNDWRLKPEEAMNHRFTWGDYIALSYVWGDAKRRKNIIVDGHTLSVTANLYDALVSLRDSAEISRRKLHVWIDAICINQQDLAERACEVQKMSIIYSECLAVRAWLGGPKDPAGAAIISKIRHFLDDTVHVNTKQCTWEMAKSFIEASALVDGAHMLLTIPYWKRLWIIQEMSLAPSLHFKFGLEQFTTLDLVRLAGWCALDDQPLSQKSSPDLTRPAWRLQRLRRWIADADKSKSNSSLLVEIARLARASQATDPRDKLYGLLALLPTTIAKCIRPDYSSSNDVVKIFTHFSQTCYKSEGNLNILAWGKNLEKRSDMPTWALDLGCDFEEDEPRGLVLDASRHRRHLANNHMSAAPFYFTHNGRQLRCQGVIVDTVRSLASSAADSAIGVKSWMETAQKSKSESDGRERSLVYKDAALALCRVLMTDEDMELKPSHPSILDIPWLSPHSLGYSTGRADNLGASPGSQDNHSSTAPTAWPELYRTTGFTSIFRSCLHPNALYDIGGRPLQSYFAASTKVCQDSGVYRSILYVVGANLLNDRIFTTSHNRVGLAPKSTEVGDKIAILCNCDKPMVLRSVGRSYEVVGSCFIEGLMKGETADLIKDALQGLQTQELVLY